MLKKYLLELQTLLWLIAAMWAGYIASLHIPLSHLGIFPRQQHGLFGILLAPFLHGNLAHITTNTSGIVIFGFLYVAVKAKDTFKTCLWITVFSGAATWLIGRPAYHIGASGLVFGLYGYLIAHGWYSRKFVAFFVSIGLVVLYGGVLMGVLPTSSGISWESHLFGFIGGFLLARGRNEKEYKKLYEVRKAR